MKLHIIAASVIASSVWVLPPSSISRAQADPAPGEPTRIVLECEDMRGVNQTKFGPGVGWQVGRWGQDLYQNMIFGGVWASRLRTAMTDAGDAPSEVSSLIYVPADGTYKVWAKYECPPNFNYAFGIRVEPVGGKPIFNKTYGLLTAEKQYSYKDELMRGSLYWSWGLDHDAAEGYEVRLKRGDYRVTLSKAKNVQPAGARSVDAILITSDLSPISTPRYPRFPLLDELRRANHLYVRFRNTGNQPARFAWNHWGHRPPDYYYATYRELVRFYDASGKPLPTPQPNSGDWLTPVAPGGASVWYDLGPTVNTESSTPFAFKAVAPDTPVPEISALAKWGGSRAMGVDLALAPDAKRIVKSFNLGPGESELNVLVQPDLNRPEGQAATLKINDIYRNATRVLNAEPRLGPIPQKLKIFADTGRVSYNSTNTANSAGWDFTINQEFRTALGLNTLPLAEFSPESAASAERIVRWSADKGGIVPRSAVVLNNQNVDEVIDLAKKTGLQDKLYYLSYGDEIGLPAVDVNDVGQVAAFRDYVKAAGESPQSLGLPDWEHVKPLRALSSEVAVQIGVLPQGAANDGNQVARLKRLYWYSVLFSERHGLAIFAAKTAKIRAELGDAVQTTANLGGMHPFYWMGQDSFIDAFKYNALTLAWSEDYTYCQPEASRLVADFEASYLRKGASYHDTPMQFYCMPHYPGNTPEHLLQNAVMLWGQNVKDLDWFNASPDAWATENYVTYRGGMPTWKMLRTISGMAGLVENDLLPARPVKTPVAMLISRSSDIWELDGGSQGDVAPGTVATNVSQEERKNLYYALRLAGYRVDFVTEDDVKEGLLKNYKMLYVSGQNLERRAGKVIKEWVQDGGVVMATAGAARKDEFDEPYTGLDEVLGRGTTVSYERYHGPLRAKIELLFEKPKDQVRLGTSLLDAYCSREKFTPLAGAEILGRYVSDGSPALVKHRFGKGTTYYTGTLPGQAFVKRGLPLQPMGKGGGESNFSHFEPVDYDAVARDLILRPVRENGIVADTGAAHRSVVCSRLASLTSTVVPIVNLAEGHDGTLTNLQVTLKGLDKAPRRVWSAFYKMGLPYRHMGDNWVVTLPTLRTADVIILSY